MPSNFLPAALGSTFLALVPAALPGAIPAAPAAAGGVATGHPNIIVLLADDLGWHDLGCTGNPEYRTPQLDRLAAEGMRFTEAHCAAPICSASRAALLTGQSPARLHYEFVPKFNAGRQQGPWPMLTPDYPTELPPATPTVATALRAAGYATAFCGKWHLNRHQGHYLGWRPGCGPADFGFEHCVDDFGGHPYGYPKAGAPPPVADGTFPTDHLTDGAIEFVRRDHGKPFLLWMSYYLPFYQPETRFEDAKPAIGVNDFAIRQSRPHAALRAGNLKLIHHFETGKDELFDLAADPSEARNLVHEQAAMATELRQRLLAQLAAQSARLPVRKP